MTNETCRQVLTKTLREAGRNLKKEMHWLNGKLGVLKQLLRCEVRFSGGLRLNLGSVELFDAENRQALEPAAH